MERQTDKLRLGLHSESSQSKNFKFGIYRTTFLVDVQHYWESDKKYRNHFERTTSRPTHNLHWYS